MLTKEQIKRQEAIFRKQVHDVLVTKCDANETAFLERQIVQLRAKIFQVEFADLIGRTFVPMATDIASSAETYSYGVETRVGRARISADGSGAAPRVDVHIREVTGKVRAVDDAYGWTINQMREAARIGQDLSGRKARAARDAIETAFDEMLAYGDLTVSTGQSNVLCAGLINNPDVEALGIGNPGHDPWTMSTSSLDIVADVNAQLVQISQESSEKFQANRLVYAPREYDILARKPYSDASDKTILRWLLENNPGLQISKWYRLTGKGAGGTNRSIAYKYDPLILEGVIPQEFEQLPPQAVNAEFLITCLGRCGGVKIYQPLAVRYTDYSTS